MPRRARAHQASTMSFSVNFLCTLVGAALYVPHANPRRTPVRNTGGKTIGTLCTLQKAKTGQTSLSFYSASDEFYIVDTRSFVHRDSCFVMDTATRQHRVAKDFVMRH